MKLHLIDVLILLAYLVTMIVIGFWMRKKAGQNKDSYLMGGKSLPWLMAVSRNDFNVGNPTERIIIGATRNWSRNVILWNIAADPQNKLHADNGGCAGCQGAITIDGDKVNRNLAYYTIGHVSKFVPANSVRVESSLPDGLSDVAFNTPEGKTVLVVANKGKSAQTFKIAYKNKTVTAQLSAASVATYVW
ncbi:MAG: hypothetical protein H7289_16410 [Mucilaginibacter sp.]|nr:hypothetical protein [Mucilaginibacter sp.]